MPTREQLTVCPIKRVGYFHFGADNKEHPVESLKAALELQGGLGDCLLVLPEAFNVASGYYCGQLPDQLIEAALQELSFTKGVAFVVSLIAPDVGSSGNCNSAVVIDGKSILMLSKKRTSIRRELDGECVFGDVQIVHRGLRIAALICATRRIASARGGSQSKTTPLRSLQCCAFRLT